MYGQTENENQQAKEQLIHLASENEKLRKDINWLANSAKNSKMQADKAICDLQAYSDILRGMEKKLA